MRTLSRSTAAAGAADRGWAELAGARWAAARESFARELEREETPRALEGLSWAAWWLDDADTVFEARERAYRLYRRSGDVAGAARMAIWLAADHLDFRGALAVTSGWLRRARRLLDPLESRPEHGWLAFHEGYLALIQGDTARSAELAERATALGRRFHVADLEMLGLALQGSVLVGSAQVREGMACLDEAAATALAGDAEIPISSAWVCCFLVSACEAVRDYARAFEWCDRIAEFAKRFGSRYMLGFCRAHYAAIHVWRGRWTEAEAELEAAIDAYSVSRPAFLPAVRAELAELRRRQGRWAEAERQLEQAGAGSAFLYRARLALDRGHTQRAIELAERSLRRIPEHVRLNRAPVLELLVRGLAADGHLDRAATALEELRAVATLVGTLPVHAGADLAEGLVAASAGNHEKARALFEDAIDGFERSGAPFEAAQARIELVTSLLAAGRRDEAAREATSCVSRLTDLGAETEAARARRLLDLSVGSVPDHRVSTPLRAITRREREVLRWVAEGLTNRQIAERLVVSEHTIHRHVTAILRKLDVPSRAAAAAHAVRSGLLEQSR